jgi:hypothetical protein
LDGAEVREVTGELEGGRLDVSEGVVFRNAVVRGADLSGQRIPHYQAFGSSFEACDFSRSTLVGSFAAMPGATYRGCCFDRADLRGILPSVARFERCSFRQAKLDKWFAYDAEFIACTFAGRLRTVRFSGMPGSPGRPPDGHLRLRNEFVGNDFREAELLDVDFVRGIDIGVQSWPSDPAYARIADLRAGLKYARVVIAGWPDDPVRARALEMIDWSERVYDGQHGLVRRRGQGSNETELRWTLIEEGSRLAVSDRRADA